MTIITGELPQPGARARAALENRDDLYVAERDRIRAIVLKEMQDRGLWEKPSVLQSLVRHLRRL